MKEELNKKFPCREKFIEELGNYLPPAPEEFPPSIFVYGVTGTGKSSIVKEFVSQMPGTKYSFVNCIECYTSKILFEKIINGLQEHELCEENHYESYASCETFRDFIIQIQALDDSLSYVICLDNAEKLREMEYNIIPGFINLNKLVGLNICTVLISEIIEEKYLNFMKGKFPGTLTIHSPQYTREEILKILVKDFDTIKQTLELTDYDQINVNFYENYLDMFLGMFYVACNDLPELELISTNCLRKYVEPIVSGELDVKNVAKLWRMISVHLAKALSHVYMRMECNEEQNLARSLDLSYCAKYLLIAAFLASHNSAKCDKRLFVKNQAKRKKRLQSVNANAKTVDKMSTSLGPKSFPIVRLLAIFYAIVEEEVGLSCKLMVQMSTLIQLKLLSYVSGENNVMEGSTRLQCTVGLQFITDIGKTVGFNVRQYLSDFM